MSKKEEREAIERTRLAEKRTELAHERTVLAYIRTGTTVILFGIGFFGFSQMRGDFFYYSGIVSIVLGVAFLAFSFSRGLEHLREIKRIKSVLGRVFKKS